MRIVDVQTSSTLYAFERHLGTVIKRDRRRIRPYLVKLDVGALEWFAYSNLFVKPRNST